MHDPATPATDASTQEADAQEPDTTEPIQDEPTQVAPITQDEKWTTGDFTLVSSDNVLFKVDSFYLFAARYVLLSYARQLICSSVFRDARPLINSPHRLEFTDEKIETAAVLRYFLSLVAHGKVITVKNKLNSYEELHPLCDLVRFLVKYSCTVHLENLNSWLRAYGKQRGLLLFAIAALQDNASWCATLIKDDRAVWESYLSTKQYHLSLADKQILDPSGAPYWFMEVLPFDYLWSLTRAWGAFPDKSKRSERATKFEELIKLVKEGECTKVWATLTTSGPAS